MIKSKIKFLVMDVDGTLTDGKIYMGNSGELMKAFCIKDGCGIHDILIPTGIIPLIITGRESQILLNRCKEIGIKEVHQGIREKAEKLEVILKEYSHKDEQNYYLENVAYIGDDINDLEIMKAIKEKNGIVGCPCDAVSSVRETADFVATRRGGDGAVREFIEWLIY